MGIFVIMSRYFWLIAIAVTGINAYLIKFRSTKYIRENPELSDGYKKLVTGYFILLNIPWVVMGVGCIIGKVPSLWHFFKPRDGNPYVLAWFGSVFILWILYTIWLFFKGGTVMLSKHPGVFGEITNPTLIKLFSLLMIAGGIFGFVFMWIIDIPIPKFQ
ncbi:MAG: hypothetical protein FVQ84_09485 [Planctomycetes bacterium]|nr:hypothetical protein [Planctomycetota bacterium]